MKKQLKWIAGAWGRKAGDAKVRFGRHKVRINVGGPYYNVYYRKTTVGTRAWIARASRGFFSRQGSIKDQINAVKMFEGRMRADGIEIIEFLADYRFRNFLEKYL